MSMETEDVRFSFFQKPFHESNYPLSSKEDFCFQLIRNLQTSISSGRRRKFGEIGIAEQCNAPKKAVRKTVCQPVEKKDLVNALPDELLIEVFRCVSGPADRYACASVCMRWLVLQSHLDSKEIKREQETKSAGAGDELKRNLEGKRATDVRLALIALGTQGRGGLGKLTIKGGPRQNPAKAVSDVGISAIGISCENLKILSVWDCPYVGDAGFSWIGKGCSQLKALNVLNCPGFGDAGLQAIAAGCRMLSSLSLEGCEKIGNAGLEAVAKYCTQLSCLSIVGCKNVADAGVVSVVSNCKLLKALKIEKVGIRDEGLIAIGKHGSSLQKLKLAQLDQTSANGFFLLGRDSNMTQLKHVQIVGCRGLNDGFLEGIGKASKEIKFLYLSSCGSLSESSLLTFMNDCTSMETLHLERCAFSSMTVPVSASNGCSSLKVLNIVNCSGVGSSFFAALSGSSFLKELDFTGDASLSDEDLVTLLSRSGSSVTSLNLSGCSKITDNAVAAVAAFCPSLESLTLEGCGNVTDEGLQYISEESQTMQDVNISKCAAVTDDGVRALVAAKGSSLKTFSLAGCVRITDRSLEQIEEACEDLEALNIKDCKGLSRGKVEALESRLWRCELCF